MRLPLGRRLPPHFPLLVVLILVVGSLTVGPVLMLVLGSLSEGIGAFGVFTFDKYITAYTDPAFPTVVLNTLIFSLGAASFSTVLGAFLAYLSVRTNIPFKGVFRVLPVVPMMIPHVLFAAAWIMLLNPTNGVLNIWLRQLLGYSPFNIYSLGGMIFLEGLLDLPVTYLVMSPAMYSFDTALEDASRMSGASNLYTLRKITLPMMRPALLAALSLGIIRSLAAFAVPQMVGMPGRIHVLTTYVYRVISVGWSPDYGRAAAIGVSVLALAIVLIYLYRHLTAASERYVTVTGKGFRPTTVELGWARYVLFGLASLLFCLLVVVPLITLVYISLLPYNMVPSARALDMLTLRNWTAVIRDPVSLRALGNSAFLATVGATLGILLSVFVAYVVVKVRSRGSGILESMSFLSFSFPGLIIGVGFLWFFVLSPLYATIWALLLAYIGTYMPYGVRPLTSAFIQVHHELEEASRVCGAGFLKTLRNIVVPLLAPGVLSAWILMACMFLRELSVSVVLSRPGTEVLTIQIMKYAYDALWGRVAALGLIMVALSTTLVLAATFIRSRLSRID